MSDLILDDYLHHMTNVDTALILDQALDLRPLPDDDRDAYEDADDDEYGRDQ